MKKLYCLLFIGLWGCNFDLEEKVYDRIDASLYYSNEAAVKGAVASIYSTAALSYIEFFYYLQEFSADQMAWRCWNDGWGYDNGQKTDLQLHIWTPDSWAIERAWSTAWTTIGMCNTALDDLSKVSAGQVGITDEKLDMYRAEIRNMRAWSYYNLFEIWGGALPLSTTVTTELPGSVSADFDEGCQIIWNFLVTELDETVDALPKNEVNRANQAMNRVLKARLLLNSKLFTGVDKFSECATLCQDILDGDFGTYSIASNFQDIYSINNTNCPEVIFAFPFDKTQLNGSWMRTTGFPYNIWDYMNGTYTQSGWNCVIVAPSFDNSGTVLATGGTSDPKSFLGAPYNDRLGAVYERFHANDIRRKDGNFKAKADGTYTGLFLKGEMKANFGTGEALMADADREGTPLIYVDQVGTFLGVGGQTLADVQSPRRGETNSGIRLVRYPIFPEAAGIDFQDIDEVEFRLAEVTYMLAECKLRAGDAGAAKSLVNDVRKRYFSTADWSTAQNDNSVWGGAADEDWMLDQWGQEFLSEGRRRRTDLRRFDKFTKGRWWFFGRTSDDGIEYPAQRAAKYEWFPLPTVALSTNKGLVQNPNY